MKHKPPPGVTWLPEDKGPLHLGCLNCSTASRTLPGRRHIAVGFGNACLLRDRLRVWSEAHAMNLDDCLTVRNATRRVRRDPNHDWRIVLHGPMHGETFQWQGDRWVLIESNKGFA